MLTRILKSPRVTDCVRAARGLWRPRVEVLPLGLTLARCLLLAVVTLGWGCSYEDDATASKPNSEASATEDIPLAPGYRALEFQAPEPGSYALPPLGDAANGQILTIDGTSAELHELIGGKVVVLSLMYASCSDVNGCPLATAVLHQIARKMEEDAGMAADLRLVSLSFDPIRDTPAVMKKYGAHHSGHGVDWQFLTTRSDAELRPILDDYGQSLVPEFDENGNEVGDFSHILRVFLIDSARRIRNIYSVSFLHTDTLIADIKTLQLETALSREDASRPEEVDSKSVGLMTGSGDARNGYESREYSTQSVDLRSRRGEALNLVDRAAITQFGLPRLAIPADNPLTREKVALGRALFFDRRLSQNATLSCAMCHVPEQGFANNELATAVGIEGRTVRRNAPTILNVGYVEQLFHDGRENRLEQQVWGPLLARNEMGNPSVGAVIERIRGLGAYDVRFREVFPERGLAIETVGMAIASYERTLVSGDSPFDRWLFGHDEGALSDEQVAGFELFVGRAGCSGCHTIDRATALLTDGRLHNTGIGYRASMSANGATQAVQLAPGEYVELDRGLIDEVSAPRRADLGRYEITQNPEDRWKYTTPSLRNVALTAPYMHDGSVSTLREVVEFYDRGGVGNPTLDPRIHRLGLSALEIDRLTSFLESLTGGDVDLLVGDGIAAPIGDYGVYEEASSIDATRSSLELSDSV